MMLMGLVGLVLGAVAVTAAGPESPKGYVCGRVSEPIRIDGRLDDAGWTGAPWTDDFVDIQGDAKPKPRFKTRAKLAWDDQYLYIAAELSEPHVWGTLTRHDSVIFQDNDFEVFLDPDGDNHEYMELEFNVLNTEWDLLLGKPYRDGGPARDEWEVPGLKSAVHVDGTLNDPSDVDRGWTIEIAIPWSAMVKTASRPTPPRDGDRWRLNFSRVEWEHTVEAGAYRKVPGKPEDNWVWSPQGAIDMHRPERWGYLLFSGEKPGAGVYRPDPDEPARDYLMALYFAQRAYRDRNGRFAERVDQLELGAPPAIPPGAAKPGSVQIRLTPEGYEATLGASEGPAEGGPGGWTIRHDSKLTPAGSTPAKVQP